MIPLTDLIKFFEACYDDSEPTESMDDFGKGPLYKKSVIEPRRAIVQHIHPERKMGIREIYGSSRMSELSHTLMEISRTVKQELSRREAEQFLTIFASFEYTNLVDIGKFKVPKAVIRLMENKRPEFAYLMYHLASTMIEESFL